MKNRRLSSYSSREQGLELSCKLAREQLSKITDIQEQCRKSGARYISDGQIAVDYLNQAPKALYTFDTTDGQISNATLTGPSDPWSGITWDTTKEQWKKL